MPFKPKVTFGGSFVTGLKVILLNIIAGILTFIASFLLSLIGVPVITKIGEAPQSNMIAGLVFIFVFFMMIVLINGYVARKLFKWK